MSRTYGYYNLELVSEKLVIPLKLYNVIETEPKMAIKQGKINKESGTIEEIKTVRVIMKDGEIRETVNWFGNETFYEKNGKLVEIPSEIQDLIKQDEERRKSKTIEFLGLYPNSKLGWEHFNGKQFIAEVGSKMKKQILMKENALYSGLYKIMKNEDGLNGQQFMLIRFFTRSGQELGALFADGENRLRISGVYSDKALKMFSKCELPSEISESSVETVKKLLDKLSSREPNFNLDWKEYYQMCVENNGLYDKPFIKNETGKLKDTGDEELSKLLETLV